MKGKGKNQIAKRIVQEALEAVKRINDEDFIK
jgi:ribosomal protein S7